MGRVQRPPRDRTLVSSDKRIPIRSQVSSCAQITNERGPNSERNITTTQVTNHLPMTVSGRDPRRGWDWGLKGGENAMEPKHRRWVLVVVVYNATNAMHMDAIKDSILAALAAKLIDGQIKKKP